MGEFLWYFTGSQVSPQSSAMFCVWVITWWVTPKFLFMQCLHFVTLGSPLRVVMDGSIDPGSEACLPLLLDATYSFLNRKV